MVVPDALRVLKLKPMRKYTVLGRLSQEVGWKHSDTIAKLEEKRKIKAAAWYKRKKAWDKIVHEAKSVAHVAKPVATVKTQ